MFAVTSIIESSNPYLFYSIKEFLNSPLPQVTSDNLNTVIGYLDNCKH